MSEAINYYQKAVVETAKELGIDNIMAYPKIIKAVVNISYGNDRGNKSVVESARADLAAITGQKPVQTKAKKSVASFKVRKGENIGLKVTLRKNKMIDFVYKLVFVALPSIRDFRGVPVKSLDGSGNYTVGIKDINVFPEISFSKDRTIRGCEVTIVTNLKDNEKAKVFIKNLGFPFQKENNA